MVDGVGTTHHVKIGDHHYLLGPNGYRVRAAQQFGPRFTTGDPDYNNLSAWQHWVQKCWVGGHGAAEWKDDAMFDEGIGVDTRHHELMVLTRDLGPSGPGFDRAAWNWTADGGTGFGFNRRFFVYNNDLFVVCWLPSNDSYVYRFEDNFEDGVTPYRWTLVGTFSGVEVRSVAVFRGYAYFGTSGSDIAWMHTTAPGATPTFGTTSKPSGETHTPYAMMAYGDRMYVGFGQDVWRMKNDGTWDGSTAFHTNAGINYVDSMEVHQGFLYMASQNGHILRSDGNNTFDMFQFDSGAGIIADVKSFDGRLFILVCDPIEGLNTDPFSEGASATLVLYQLSGAALTELKRWGRVGRYMYASKMRVADGKLYFGASDLLGMGDGTGGFGIAMYDPVEDAHHLVATCRDTETFAEGTNNVAYATQDVILFRDKLFVSAFGPGIMYTLFTYRDMERLQAAYDTTASGSGLLSKNGGWFASSDFNAGTPGLQKIWNAIIVDIDLPDASCSALVEYSLDGGLTWVTAGSITTAAAVRLAQEIVLGDGVTEVRGARFKYRVTLRTTSSAYSPILRGVTVRYLPVPEPNWVWDLTIVLSDKQQLLDKTIQTPDNTTKLAALRSAFRTQSLIPFTDADGDQWAADGKPGVLILTMEEHFPYIGPSSDGDVEREVRLTLMEMVEQYEES